jgi:hypothetical protein
MRQWDLETSAANLHDAIDELQVAWQESGEYWDDEVSRKYCEQHLDPIGPAMKLALDAIARMNQLVARIQHECES